MSEHKVTVEGGSSVRLLTARKYCDRDIVVEATGGGGGGGIACDDIASAGITGDIELSVTSIASMAFSNNAGITSLSAPNVTSIGTYGFYNSTGMKSVNLPSVKTISTYCLSGMKITELSLPECTSIGDRSFNGCKNIAKLELPKCKTIGASCLSNILITELVLPECTSIGNSSLSGLTECTYVDLPKCTKLITYALRNSANLKTLILRSETLCALSGYALNSTKIWNGTGYVYVPRALIESYQTATNWATIYSKNANVFRALEDYTVDGTIIGELDESKV